MIGKIGYWLFWAALISLWALLATSTEPYITRSAFAICLWCPFFGYMSWHIWKSESYIISDQRQGKALALCGVSIIVGAATLVAIPFDWHLWGTIGVLLSQFVVGIFVARDERRTVSDTEWYKEDYLAKNTVSIAIVAYSLLLVCFLPATPVTIVAAAFLGYIGGIKLYNDQTWTTWESTPMSRAISLIMVVAFPLMAACYLESYLNLLPISFYLVELVLGIFHAWYKANEATGRHWMGRLA